MAKYQLQMHQVLNDGTDVFLYPINTALDVQVGKLSTGSLTLPGNASDEILSQTLANIKKYLTNLGTVATQKRGVSDSTTSTSSIDLATSKAVNDLKVRIDGNDEILATHTTEIAGKAPINHAVKTLTYGGATGALYGHVKLSDTYTTAVSNGSAAYSIGASQNALYNAYNALNTSKAPNNHAANNSTYGLGTASLYGHVKLSDTYSSKVSSGAAANSLGASQNALYNAYNTLKTVNDSQATAINGKAPTQHASTAAATYGAGTGSYYGHVMLSDSFDTDNSATGAAANSIGASSWAVYRAYSNLATAVSTKLAATHANEVANAGKFSHVKLSDNYTSSAGAASAGIGASSLAVYNTYAAFSSFKTSAENSISTLNKRMEECLKSVADGKSLLATSISAYVTTASDATWATINTNMKTAFTNRYNAGVSATKKGTAGAAQVLTGYTFTNSSSAGISGTMANNGAWTSASSGSGNITIPAGYHDGNGYVDCSGAYNAGVKATKKGTAGAAQVLTGYTFTNSSSVGISGTMKNNGAWTSNSSGSGNIKIPAGYHNGNGYVNCDGAYNAGVTAADNRANANSANYKAGYNAGYSAGYSKGYKYVYQEQNLSWIDENSNSTPFTFNLGLSNIVSYLVHSQTVGGDYPGRIDAQSVSGGTVSGRAFVPQGATVTVKVLAVGT